MLHLKNPDAFFFKDPTVSALVTQAVTFCTSNPFPSHPGSLSAVCSEVRGDGVRALRAGSGTLSWTGEDADEPLQHRAALMKSPAAGRPSGYADHWLNWPNEMQCNHGEVNATGQRRLQGQKEAESFIFVFCLLVSS